MRLETSTLNDSAILEMDVQTLAWVRTIPLGVPVLPDLKDHEKDVNQLFVARIQERWNWGMTQWITCVKIAKAGS